MSKRDAANEDGTDNWSTGATVVAGANEADETSEGQRRSPMARVALIKALAAGTKIRIVTIRSSAKTEVVSQYLPKVRWASAIWSQASGMFGEMVFDEGKDKHKRRNSYKLPTFLS